MEPLRNKVTKCEFSIVTRTDHEALLTECNLVKEKRGPGTWKFNNMLLLDEHFVNKIKGIIKLAGQKYSMVNPGLKWELIKGDIISETKNYSILRAAAKNKEYVKLKARHQMLVNSMAQSQNSVCDIRETRKELKKTEFELEQYVKEKAQGVRFRSKARWVAEGEKCTKYYLNMEKRNYENKRIAMLKTETGELIMDQDVLRNMLFDFYSQLYKSNPEVQFNFVNESGVSITDVQKKRCDETITLNECKSALFSMKNDKSPGIDGLTVEMYKMFWNELAAFYLEAIQYGIENKKLHVSALRGLIMLLPKKGKDSLLLKNWRPLTMLNIDYKIYAKVLASRIKEVLSTIISDDQVGFMKNRQISTTIRKTMDIIHELKSQHRAGYVINLDFHKCFDMIEAEAITASLRYFGFGEEFVNMINILQTEFESCVAHNGYLTDWFGVTRSTHQGDPVAPYLYLLCGEIMSHLIKQNKEICPLIINGDEEPLSQFADDTQLFQEPVPSSLTATEQVLETVKANMGLQINYEKSQIHMIESQKCPTVANWSWTYEYPKILGIDTNPASDQLQQLLAKGEGILSTWYYRGISLSGKIVVVNTLVASLYIYALQVLDDPHESFFVQFNQIIERFLWKGSKHKLPLEVLCASKNSGGCKLVNLSKRHQSLKICWLFKETNFISNMLNKVAPEALGMLFWDVNLCTTDLAKYVNVKCPEFWKQICYHWFDYKWGRESITPAQQIIWCNSQIRVKNEVLYNEKAIRKGLLYVYQLYDDGKLINSGELQDLYGLSWMEILQLIDAIPKEWKCHVMQNPVEWSPTLYDRLKHLKKPAAVIYTSLIEDSSVLLYHWNKMMKNVKVTTERLRQAFLKIYSLTNVVKYRDFQYRLLASHIPLNNKLFYWGKVESQLCEWCNASKQTVSHFFYECVIAKKMWDKLKEHIDENIKDIPIMEWGLEEIILGDIVKKNARD